MTRSRAWSPSATPNSGIELNAGNYVACNVGNSGAGGLPCSPVPPQPHPVARCIAINQGDALACSVGSVDGWYPA